MKNVYIFTKPGCYACSNLKQRLTDQSISFIEINTLALENKELWEDFKTQTEFENVPQVFIQDEDKLEGLGYVPYKDWNSVDEIVDIIKKNI